jgi:chromosome transmission fidelity protein 18
MGEDQIPSGLLPSYDPAIFLHSEPDHAPATFFSDDLIAIQLQIQETIDEKNRERIVIQHRAWNTNEVFRSEEDHPIRELAIVGTVRRVDC